MFFKSKYKGCILPVREEWQVLREDTFYRNEKIITKVRNFGDMYEAFSDIIDSSFYYPYNIKIVSEKNLKTIGHSHAHSFMEVVEIVYYYPESFSIDKADYEFYSKQELKYLKRLQNYLLAIGLKDIEKYNKKELIKRAKNKKAKQFSEYQTIETKYANDIITGKIKNMVTKYFEFLNDYKTEKCLLLDKENNYLGIILTKRRKIKLDDLTEQDINVQKLGYQSLDEYKKHIEKRFNDSYYKLDQDKNVILEEFSVIEQFKD